ncbi:hypothetical protein A2U01_0051740, partial [Trifolium medium]|nr:hypothetical protein [Trifolium medium]
MVQSKPTKMLGGHDKLCGLQMHHTDLTEMKEMYMYSFTTKTLWKSSIVQCVDLFEDTSISGIEAGCLLCITNDHGSLCIDAE